jgi:hypothetical protein
MGLLEALAKTVAILTAAALGTGFLYDAIYFMIVNPRLLQLLVLSDHIETAVTAVPLVTVLGVILAFQFQIAQKWLAFSMVFGSIVGGIATLWLVDREWLATVGLAASGIAFLLVALGFWTIWRRGLFYGLITQLAQPSRKRLIVAVSLAWI